jgi:hypothetical protein
MDMSQEIESYLIGVHGSTRRKRVNRPITEKMRAYRNRGHKEDGDEE